MDYISNRQTIPASIFLCLIVFLSFLKIGESSHDRRKMENPQKFDRVH
jgi:hypothetical protein